MSVSLFELIRAAAPADADTPLIEIPDGATISYGDMELATARYARFLRDLGTRPGDRVAVQVEKSPEALFLYLACVRAGLVFLPMNTAYTVDEVAFLAGDAEPAVLVCDPGRLAEIEPPARAAGAQAVLTLDGEGRGSFSDGAATAPADFPPEPCAAADLAALLYTSGTTGRPKGAMLSHGNLASNAQVLVQSWGFRADDVLLHALPIYHTHGLFVACHCVLLAGARMIWLARFESAQVLALLPRATVFMGVPTYYTRLLAEEGLSPQACANMRLFVSGSAPLLAETHGRFEARTGHAVLERYGMTETGMSTSNPLEGPRRPGTVGPPLPGVEARVRRDDGRLAGVDEVGDLEVRGPNVFSGYWRMPEKTVEEFTEDGWFKTGDVAKIDDQGYVHLVGRAKDLVISGGLNVYPKEVEDVIDRIAGVDESAVIGVPHADFGEAVAAVVTLADGAQVSEAEVIAEAKRHLAAFKVPKRVFFVRALPRNTMGKVQKVRLRERYAEAFK